MVREHGTVQNRFSSCSNVETVSEFAEGFGIVEISKCQQSLRRNFFLKFLYP